MNLFNIAYVKYWFLYKSFNTKNLFKKRREPGHCVLEAKVYEFHFFSVQFCTGTPSFPCFDVLTETKSSTRETKRRVSEGFVKSIYVWQQDLQGHCPHLCASRLFALVLEILSLHTAPCNLTGDLFGTRLEEPTAWSHCRCGLSTIKRWKTGTLNKRRGWL